MKIVLDLPDDIAAAVLAYAINEGKTFDQAVNELAEKGIEMRAFMPEEEAKLCYENALRKVHDLAAGTTFVGNELFGYDWGRIHPNQRKSFGRSLRAYFEETNVAKVKEKTAQNHMIYEKI